MSKSDTLFQQAQQYLVGGVNSPVRSFKGVGGNPLFFDKAVGAYVYDVDGHSYIDYVGSWGPMIQGHNHADILTMVSDTMKKGLSFGAPCQLETQLAQLVCEMVPSVELVRFVNSGTEATMSAIRLARAYTKRDKIIKFNGCYHGHSDSFLVNAGSGALTLGIPSSPGVPQCLAELTLTAEFNNLTEVAALFNEHGNDIAAIIVEPIAGNMGCIPPVDGFLKGLRQLCDQHQSLLIFDEVMTGFRVASGGAQQLYNIKPDLTTLGKIIGGGMPVGAFGGRKDIMQQLAPLGPVYQAGTLSGNPVAMAAGIANLSAIKQPEFYQKLAEVTYQLVDEIKNLAIVKNISLATNVVPGMFSLFFTEDEKINSFQQVKNSDINRYNTFFHGLLKQGVYFAPSAYEASFISSAHGQQEIEKTLQAIDTVFSEFSSV